MPAATAAPCALSVPRAIERRLEGNASGWAKGREAAKTW